MSKLKSMNSNTQPDCKSLPDDLCNIWAKKRASDNTTWHPLVLHMLDVAVVAEAILDREPESTKKNMAVSLGMEWRDARSWLLLIIACHDLGKACPGFQCLWPNAPKNGLRTRIDPNTAIHHGFLSQLALTDILRRNGWPEELASLAGEAVGCHHGDRLAPYKLQMLAGDERAIGGEDWSRARETLFTALSSVFPATKKPIKSTLSGPEFMLLAGLTSFSDWIGSDETKFPFGCVEDCRDLAAWYNKRRACADLALNAIGWMPRSPLSPAPKSFEQALELAPRPLQQAVSRVLETIKEPSIILIEAPMGEGKTEAAFFAHLELQRNLGHRGLYIALPTKATGNAMFERTVKFLSQQKIPRKLDIQLIHGGTLSNDKFQEMRLSGIYDSSSGGEIRAAEWFTSKKKALLSEYGVGTVDQAIIPILPVRHNFMRLWGLANRVVVFDEIHAYDAYTGTLLVHLLPWLLAMGSSIVLLSATLSPRTRRKLAEAVGARLPEREEVYPRLSVFRPGAPSVEQHHFPADPARRLTVRLSGIQAGLPSLYSALMENLKKGGMGLALVNTVQRAQDLYRLFPGGVPVLREGCRVGKRLEDGTEILLFHARFPAKERQKREEHVLEVFNKDDKRTGRRILIATQVAEQSLDLDFDLIVTDLAPVDLVLQRAGRLWRHSRPGRAVPEPRLIIAGLSGKEPPLFDSPLWWGAVYPREGLLLRTWNILHTRKKIILPDEIDTLVQAVYEGREEIPEALKTRLEKAEMEEEGRILAEKNEANQAIIGLPDDSSWNRPGRFVLYDEDAAGVHKTLMVKTRLGGNSVVAVPVFPQDNFAPARTLGDLEAKEYFMRSLSLSRKGVVARLHSAGVPEGWKQSPLLRNCFPLLLDADSRWAGDKSVRWDDELGLVYDVKEAG